MESNKETTANILFRPEHPLDELIRAEAAAKEQSLSCVIRRRLKQAYGLIKEEKEDSE